MKMKENYKLIDIFKFVFAICVIGIHTNIVTNFNSNIQWYIFTMLFRISVPFFFMTSGFFFGRKYIFNKGDLDVICLKQLKRLFIPLIFWLLISLPYILVITIRKHSLVSTIIIIFRDILFYPWGALWYVLATMVAIILLRFFIKKERVLLAIFFSIILFAICLLGNSYYFLLSDINLTKVMDIYLSIFVSTRNGLFTGFPLFTFGYYIALKELSIVKINTKIIFFLLFLFLSIQCYEVSIIRFLSNEYDYFIMTIPVVSTILMLCIKLKNINIKIDTKIFRNMSTSMYFMHRPILYYLSLLLKIFNVEISNLMLFFIVLFIIAFLIIILYKINNKYLNFILK